MPKEEKSFCYFKKIHFINPTVAFLGPLLLHIVAFKYVSDRYQKPKDILEVFVDLFGAAVVCRIKIKLKSSQLVKGVCRMR